MPPNSPNPRPPAPIRSMSRRETPQPDNRVLVVMVFASLMYFHENRLGSAPRDSDILAHDDHGAVGPPRIAPFDTIRQEHRSTTQLPATRIGGGGDERELLGGRRSSRSSPELPGIPGRGMPGSRRKCAEGRLRVGSRIGFPFPVLIRAKSLGIESFNDPFRDALNRRLARGHHSGSSAEWTDAPAARHSTGGHAAGNREAGRP